MRALSNRAGITLHIKLLDGRDPHHIVEAEFKALARALGEACSIVGTRRHPVDEGRPRMRAAVIDYDLGNLPSVTKALERIGVDTTSSKRPPSCLADFDVARPARVGHFGTGMRNLRAAASTTAIKEWAATGKPLLGICVGLRLFMESSTRIRTSAGSASSRERPAADRTEGAAHGMESLDVDAAREGALGRRAHGDLTYFVHSYYVNPSDALSHARRRTSEETFCSAVEQDNVVGVQFHPEKSADVGRRVLERYFQSL